MRRSSTCSVMLPEACCIPWIASGSKRASGTISLAISFETRSKAIFDSSILHCADLAHYLLEQRARGGLRPASDFVGIRKTRSVVVCVNLWAEDSEFSVIRVLKCTVWKKKENLFCFESCRRICWRSGPLFRLSHSAFPTFFWSYRVASY